jgi:cell wall-associated NlpC family hydrolase
MRRSTCIVFVLLVSACGSDLTVRPPAYGTSVQVALQHQLRDWEGVPYLEGGLSKAGVDCSGFVFLTFRKRFGLILPRTTDDLVSTGRRVSPRRLRPGDLLFFKTGFFKRHVGIHVEEGRFIHSSTSGGVTQSDLADPYWSKRFWQSRRVLL